MKLPDNKAIRQLSTNPKTTQALKALIGSHIRRHRFLKVEDLYKMLYQAVFGVGHLLDRDALRMLEEEMKNLPKYKREPLLESIDPKSEVYRINLRPFKQAGGDPATLFRAMKESARTMKGNPEDFLRYWEMCEDLARKKTIPFIERSLVQYRYFFIGERFPAVHHSAVYRSINRPAYRIVLKKLVGTFKPPGRLQVPVQPLD